MKATVLDVAALQKVEAALFALDWTNTVEGDTVWASVLGAISRIKEGADVELTRAMFKSEAFTEFSSSERRKPNRMAKDSKVLLDGGAAVAAAFHWATTPEKGAWAEVAAALTDYAAASDAYKPSTMEHNVNRSIAAEAASLVNKCLCWSITPEGPMYWEQIYDRLRLMGEGDFSTQADGASVENNEFDPYCVMEAPDQLRLLAAKLKQAFTWSKTPEGFDFWNDVHSRIEKLATKKKNWLESQGKTIKSGVHKPADTKAAPPPEQPSEFDELRKRLAALGK